MSHTQPLAPQALAATLALRLAPPKAAEHHVLGLTMGHTPTGISGMAHHVREVSPGAGVVVGIDGGAKTGYAVYHEASGALCLCTTTTFWGALAALVRAQSYAATGGAVAVVVEDPSGNRPTFHHGESAARKREKISRNVGANAVQARLIAEACALLGLPCLLATPGKGSGTKKSAEDFARITGYAGVTSEHARDAGMLCFGRTTAGVRDALAR